ncbi:MAG: response regulator [Planctomycetota bacterium]|nr:MAG: response regulator [Planctomycetota bacterium]
MFDFFGPKKRAEKHKILVVDDEPDLVLMLQDRLEMSGYEVVTASNGKEGLEKAIEDEPDVVLLDVRMPVMDGLEMLETLRKHPEGVGRVVIMVSARSQREDLTRAEACGVKDYVVKPFELSALIEKIGEVLERRKAAVK